MAKKKAAAKKGKTSRKTSKSASSAEMLLVGSKTKEALKASGHNVASDALEGLNGWVHWLIQQAAARASANGRKTVRAYDFMA